MPTGGSFPLSSLGMKKLPTVLAPSSAKINFEYPSILDDPLDILLSKTKNIVQDSKHTFIVHNDQGEEIARCGGLIKRLKAQFAPITNIIDRRKSKPQKGCSSVAHGTKIHRQIYHIVHCMPRETCDCEKVDKVVAKYTQMLLLKLNRLGIELVDAEIPIYCQQGGFCTRLDLVGRYALGNTPVIISLKTGYQYNFHKRKGVFSAPLEKVTCNDRNFNQLQAYAEHSILKEEYGLNFTRYLIVYVRSTGVEVEEPAKWWWNKKSLFDPFWNTLCALEK